MARKPIKRSAKHTPVEPKVVTAYAWRRRIERETGKKIKMLPGGWTQAES